MDINSWLGIGTFLVLVAGASFAFFNKFFLNPDYKYVQIKCRFNKFAYKVEDQLINVEKRNGKVNQVFCPCNQKGKCVGEDIWLYEEDRIKPPEDCWVFLN